jgi:hypothetical protein
MTKLKCFFIALPIKKQAPPILKIIHLQTLALLALTLGACHTPKHVDHQQPPFTLIEASSQQWTAGREEGGRGTEYYFKLALKTSNITFDSMWVNNYILPVFIAKETITVGNKPITYAAGDTIILRGSLLENGAVTTQTAPIKGTAAFRYIVNQQPAYHAIEHIEKKQAQKLPGHN